MHLGVAKLHLVLISVHVLPSLLEQVIIVGCYQRPATITVQCPHLTPLYRSNARW